VTGLGSRHRSLLVHTCFQLIGKQMAHASTRGSRPGERRGGRPKGGLNKRTIALRAGLEAAGAPTDQATPPFQFLSDVMNNEGNELSVRVDAAKALMPYTNFRKGMVDQAGHDVPLTVQILRFSDLEPLGRSDKPEPVVIEHDSNEAA
jgi:hypothetical protein